MGGVRTELFFPLVQAGVGAACSVAWIYLRPIAPGGYPTFHLLFELVPDALFCAGACIAAELMALNSTYDED